MMGKIELGPLPDGDTRTDCHHDGEGEPAYTADLVRAYAEAEVLKERERCAATWAKVIETATPGERYDDILKRYNFAIMNGQP